MVRVYILRVVLVRDELLPPGAVDVVGDEPWTREALGRVREAAPDVLLIDLRRPGYDIAMHVRSARAAVPEARVVVVGPAGAEAQAREAVLAGASGYLSRNLSPLAVLHAVASAARGTLHFTQTAMRAVKGMLTPRGG